MSKQESIIEAMQKLMDEKGKIRSVKIIVMPEYLIEKFETSFTDESTGKIGLHGRMSGIPIYRPEDVLIVGGIKSHSETQLLEACELVRLWVGFEKENPNEEVERIGAWFKRETGYIRPGKSCRMVSIEIRSEAWEKWTKEKKAEIQSKLADAIAAAKGEKDTDK